MLHVNWTKSGEMLKCETAHLQLHEVKRQKKKKKKKKFFHKWKMFRDKRRAAGVHQANQMEVVSIWDSHMLSLARCFFNWRLNWTITFSSKVRISIVGHLILMREVGADLSSSFSENDNTVWFRGMTSAKVKTYETFSVLMQWLKHGWMLVFLFFSYFLFGLFPNFLLPLPTHHLALTYHTIATNQGGWRKTHASSVTHEATAPFRNASHVVPQSSITNLEQSAIRPLLHTWADRCSWMPSVTLIDRGDRVCLVHPYKQPVLHSWLLPTYGCGIVNIWTCVMFNVNYECLVNEAFLDLGFFFFLKYLETNFHNSRMEINESHTK